MKIAIEGIDGVGKTTLAKYIASKLSHAKYVHFPREMVEEPLRRVTQAAARTNLFALDHSDFEQYPGNTPASVYVMERSAISMFAYDPLNALQYWPFFKYRKVDLCILLTASLDTCNYRIQQRNKKVGEDHELLTPEKYMWITRAYEMFAPKLSSRVACYINEVNTSLEWIGDNAIKLYIEKLGNDYTPRL